MENKEVIQLDQGAFLPSVHWFSSPSVGGAMVNKQKNVPLQINPSKGVECVVRVELAWDACSCGLL